MTKLNSTDDLVALEKALRKYRESFENHLIICGGTGCQASRSRDLIEAVKEEILNQKLEKSVYVRATGCHGFCEQGPIVVVEPRNIFYCHVMPEDAHEIISKTICDGEIIERLLYTDPVTGEKIQSESEIPFYLAQDRQLLAKSRHVDPCSIEDYISVKGYAAFADTIAGTTPEKVIEEIKESGLRGRGGGGFPTGLKWAACKEAPGDEKYVICNADEGDPGAYMDRSLLEGNPHMVLEGMLIGAWAVGAQRGYVYVRNEYPLALEHIRGAVKQAREWGILGENILGSSFSFDVEIARGGGAFVCVNRQRLLPLWKEKSGNPGQKMYTQ